MEKSLNFQENLRIQIENWQEQIELLKSKIKHGKLSVNDHIENEINKIELYLREGKSRLTNLNEIFNNEIKSIETDRKSLFKKFKYILRKRKYDTFN